LDIINHVKSFIWKGSFGGNRDWLPVNGWSWYSINFLQQSSFHISQYWWQEIRDRVKNWYRKYLPWRDQNKEGLAYFAGLIHEGYLRQGDAWNPVYAYCHLYDMRKITGHHLNTTWKRWMSDSGIGRLLRQTVLWSILPEIITNLENRIQGRFTWIRD